MDFTSLYHIDLSDLFFTFVSFLSFLSFNIYSFFSFSEYAFSYDPVVWVNTVRLTAAKNGFPGDRFGISIATREKDNTVLIGKMCEKLDVNK